MTDLKINFADQRPAGADTIAFIVTKDAMDSYSFPIEEAQNLKDTAKLARFKGDAGQSFLLIVREGDKMVRVILLGVGDGDLDHQKAGAKALAKVQTSGAKHISIEGPDLDAVKGCEAAYGALLRDWRIDKYRTKMTDSQKATVAQVTLVGAGEDASSKWAEYEARANGIFLTRELVSEPANIVYPETFVERCEHLKELGVEITVLDDKQMEKLGMGALLGVAQGSVRPARMLVMRWDGTDGAQERPVALVGKGVTFDTGGISLKPPGGMEDMKWDMGGAGAVAGAMKAIAGRKAKAHVVGVCGLVENMPDANAQRPGDVVTSMSGQTVEVINTDAEGRLVLCDALHWTQEEYNPEYIVDLATLTGAILVSLAHEYAGLFANNDDIAEKLTKAGKATGDEMWRMPMGKAFDKMINSPIADMKNVGPRYGGSTTAAQFLERFIKKDVKWAHLDIAGMAWSDKAGPLWAKGATGYGVALLDRFIADNFEG